MTLRKTTAWLFFPLTMWYAVGVWLRNFLFDLGVIRQHVPPVTTIGVGNLCAGGTGKTPHVEYLIRLLGDKYSLALLSRGYRRQTSGFQMDDGAHSAARLGDEPAMVAAKFPDLRVAVCEKRVEGVRRLMEQEQPPQVVLLDDVFQHRSIKPTVSILLTEYGRPYYADSVLPFGDLRESRRGRFRADIVVVTKSPARLDPIEKHLMIKRLGLRNCQKLFFSHIVYGDPLPLAGGSAEPIGSFDSLLVVTGIAHADSMVAYLSQHCKVETIEFADHHPFTKADAARIAKAFGKMEGCRKAVLTTEKDGARLREQAESLGIDRLPMYVLPIEVKLHQNSEYNFDQMVLDAMESNVLYQHHVNVTDFK